MDAQIRVLKHIQHFRHGTPKNEQCDNECNNAEFKAFCTDTGTELILVPAIDQQSTGLIKNAKRTLRSF